MLNGKPVSLYSKKQSIMILLLTKTEYIALTLVIKEVI